MSIDISALRELEGFIGGCVVDSETGLMLAATIGSGNFDLEAAGAANTQVVRAKNQALQSLGLKDEKEDILITLGKQYHLIRPLKSNPMIFIYVAVDRKTANLGMARLKVRAVESGLTI